MAKWLGNLVTWWGVAEKMRMNFDAKQNKRSRVLVNCMESTDCIVLNRRTPSDYKGHYTYTCNNQTSTIHLASITLIGITEIIDLKVLHIVTWSDHFSISSTLKTIEVIIKLEKRMKWKDDLSDKFNDAMQSSPCSSSDSNSLDEMADNLIKTISNNAAITDMIILSNYRAASSKLWCEAQCVNLKNTLEALLKDYKKHNFENDLALQYNNLKTWYSDILKAKKDANRTATLD